MSESNNIKLKMNKPNHIKGKYSMPNKNCILTINNNKINESFKTKKSSRQNTNSKSKKSVKNRNNRSFILKPRNKKENNYLNFQISTHRSISKNKNANNHKSNNILKIERKIPFHARIRSFQINYKDKDYLYNHNAKTERNNNKEKININIQKKINKNYKLEEKNNINVYNNKLNINIEDNEDNSTKNTKILEQKYLNIDDFNNNKLLILGNKNLPNYKKIKKNKEKETNKSIPKKNEKINNNNNRNKNSVILKTKIKHNINSSTSKEKEKNNNFSLINEDLNNDKKEEKNKKRISNIVQKIKDKIHNIQSAIQENNFKTTRNTKNKDISFFGDKKTTSSQDNSIQMKRINKFNKLSSKEKSPKKLKKKYKNILKDSNNFDNSSIISLKVKKTNYKNKIKIYNKSNRNKKKLFKEKNNSNFNSLYNSNNSFHPIIQKKHLNPNRSQNDIFSNFVEKNLNNNNEEENKNILKKEKNPKDLAIKEIEKIESLCEKGFLGRDVEKTNQDNFFIYKNFINNPNYIFFGVCDGHGTYGHEVSGYLVYNIPLTINDLFIKNNFKIISDKNISELISLLKNSFIEIDQNISKETNIDTLFSGSTCISLIFTATKLICANVGDSRCIVGKYDERKWFSKNLSSDHKPENKNEKERIIKNGGRIEAYTDENGEYYGPQRVWLKKENVPGLAMSRSFGDFVAHSVGVIAEPEILEYSILEEDKFIILASDGIWEFISNEECVDIVKEYYISKDINGAVNFLYKEASKRWIIKEEVIDDITLIIIFLK